MSAKGTSWAKLVSSPPLSKPTSQTPVETTNAKQGKVPSSFFLSSSLTLSFIENHTKKPLISPKLPSTTIASLNEEISQLKIAEAAEAPQVIKNAWEQTDTKTKIIQSVKETVLSNTSLTNTITVKTTTTTSAVPIQTNTANETNESNKKKSEKRIVETPATDKPLLAKVTIIII
jgi:hypothetical protein